MTATDTFTSTVDGAAAFERQHGTPSHDDRPTLADVADWPDPQPAGPCQTCDGQGEIGTGQDYFGNWDSETCRDCDGTGVVADRCSECRTPTLADELIAIDGQDVCRGCLTTLTGDDPYAPDNARDIA